MVQCVDFLTGLPFLSLHEACERNNFWAYFVVLDILYNYFNP